MHSVNPKYVNRTSTRRHFGNLEKFGLRIPRKEVETEAAARGRRTGDLSSTENGLLSFSSSPLSRGIVPREKAVLFYNALLAKR